MWNYYYPTTLILKVSYHNEEKEATKIYKKLNDFFLFSALAILRTNSILAES